MKEFKISMSKSQQQQHKKWNNSATFCTLLTDIYVTVHYVESGGG